MGKTWPASSVTNTCCAAAPLVLAVACGAWALWGLAKARFPLQLTLPISMVMVVAVWQGLTRLGWVSVRRVIGLFTGLPLHEPWITIRDIRPRTLVVVAIIFVLWTPPLRSTDGKAGTGGFPILSDPHSKRWHPDASAQDDRSSNASDG
ncbi:MAG TPA: hypothetical protein PLL20_09630 [Phycisphaerae bacterium]|nr:hypothetical protein [Phycisphaerae bacterium]